MPDPLGELLKACCVQVAGGTGFFVSPNKVLTWSPHVIGNNNSSSWEGDLVSPSWDFQTRGRITHYFGAEDIALIETEQESPMTVLASPRRSWSRKKDCL